ncbi:MAG TPA: hypothetical protein VHF47_09035 [Acidimicrobiales bacterium]|nr:hypothetical protein [Acidimicrobiales bacterium]
MHIGSIEVVVTPAPTRPAPLPPRARTPAPPAGPLARGYRVPFGIRQG